jgi:hypothetical protein
MARRKRGAADLTGILQRGGTYQVRIFGGCDPVTGKQVILTGSADSQDAAVELRDKFRTQVRERTAVRTGVTLVARVIRYRRPGARVGQFRRVQVPATGAMAGAPCDRLAGAEEPPRSPRLVRR